MDRESRILLQKIDCNCNDCIFMERDLDKFNKWKEWRCKIQLQEFKKAKMKAIADAEQIEDERSRKGMLRVAHKMKFQFDQEGIIHYGRCRKLEKEVSFLPGVCQIETQECFQHRRDNM